MHQPLPLLTLCAAIASCTGMAGSMPADVSVPLTPFLPDGGPRTLQLAILQGDGQSGPVDEPLPQPVAVRVTSEGQVVVGAVVAFTPTAASGEVERTSVASGADGVASSGAWRLGTSVGTHGVTITSPGAMAPVQVSATARPNAPVRTSAAAGGRQDGVAGRLAPVAPAMRVADRHDNPVPGLMVSFTVVQGGGTVTGSPALTDERGVATVGGWQLGPTPGRQRLRGEYPGLPPVDFEVTASAGGSPSMRVHEGDMQSATVGTAVAVRPAVIITDGDDRPLAGQPVSFSVAQGGGTVVGGAVQTGADGVARAGEWRLGPSAGPQRLRITSGSLPAVEISATAVASGAPTLTRTVLHQNLDRPWDIAFTSDGAMLFTLRGGDIRVVPPGQTTHRLLHRPADVVAQDQSGMLGIAVDPAWPTERFIYVFMAARQGNVTDNRVVRFRVNDAWDGVSERTELLTGIAYSGGAHSGGRLRFGPDGHLWITTGDNRLPGAPQSPTSLGGKVLRITRTGAIPPGNLGPPAAPSIHALGFRNPQGLAFRANGDTFLCEHGPNSDDEVTRLVAGGNGGWDPVDPGGSVTYWGYNGTVMTDLAKFPAAMRPTWALADSMGMCGCTFLSGAAWRDWDGALAVGILGGERLYILRLDAAGTMLTHPAINLPQGARLRSVVQGPDGALYIATDSAQGQIWRVTPG